MSTEIDQEEELKKLLPKIGRSLCKEAFILYKENVAAVGVEKFRQNYVPIFTQIDALQHSGKYPAIVERLSQMSIDLSNPLTYPHDEEAWRDLSDLLEFEEKFEEFGAFSGSDFINTMMAGLLINCIQDLKAQESRYEEREDVSFDEFLRESDEPLLRLHTLVMMGKTFEPGMETLKAKKARSDGGKIGGKRSNPLREELKELIREKALPLIESGKYSTASALARDLDEWFQNEGKGLAFQQDDGKDLTVDPRRMIYEVVRPMLQDWKKNTH